MKIEEKLYAKTNKKIYKTINIDDSLYEKVKELSETTYDATVSEIINIAIEKYMLNDEIKFFPRKENETVTYRNIALRKENVSAVKKICRQTGLSFTRVVNFAIQNFIKK